MKFFGVLRSKGASIKRSVVAASAVASGVLLSGVVSAQTALPAYATAGATEVEGQITNVELLWGGAIMTALVAGIVIKLVKRFGNKV